MMTPSTLIVVLVASLFVTDDVHSNPISSSEPYFKVLDCGIEGLVCLSDSHCCEGLICSKDDNQEEGFCSGGVSSGEEQTRLQASENGLTLRAPLAAGGGKSPKSFLHLDIQQVKGQSIG